VFFPRLQNLYQRKRTNQDNHLRLIRHLIFRHLITLLSNLHHMPSRLGIWTHGFRLRRMILTKDNCDTIFSIFIQLFKAKLNLVRSTSNAILLNRWIYNYRDLYGVQLQAKLSNFLIALNHQSLLEKVTNIRLLQIQSKYGLDCNPVISWPLDYIINCTNITFLKDY